MLAVRLTGVARSRFRYFGSPISFVFAFMPFESDSLNGLIRDLLVRQHLLGPVEPIARSIPLDGGQASAALFQWNDPADGLRKALMLSIGAAVLLVVFIDLQPAALSFTAVFFGYLAYENYRCCSS